MEAKIITSSQIVYILTNLAMPNYVKIGMTTNLSQRLLSLDNTSLPLPFECFYASIVNDAKFVEKQLHKAFEDKRTRKNREFFEIAPERVVAALQIAELKEVTPNKDVVENEEDTTALNKARIRRENFSFTKLNIEKDSLLTFTRDNNITCTVFDETKVMFKDTIQSLSAASKEALKDKGVFWKAVQGPLFWEYQGKTIDELRSL